MALRTELKQPEIESPSQPPTLARQPLLLIVDEEVELAERLVRESTNWGIQIKVATNLSQAREVIEPTQPDVVLLNLSCSEGTGNSLRFLAELTNFTPPVPVVVLTAEESLMDRVEIARLGGQGFLHKPISPKQVLETVTQVLEQSRPAETKVMIVDKDREILARLRVLLEHWGLRVTTLDNPKQFWEMLAASSPDLLVLDVEMPEVSGIELCQVVRSDLHWGGLPIIFLSNRTDANVSNQVFAVGADDLLSKPTVES
ncbi:MAG: hypothetical protein BRC51_05940 [Cyanobacteria bacterium SW_12_48_29]|nr:MAG: hypothetical protein BRC51_05940 [Cyanobacteria bacterium SW_12_48_29]